MTHLHKLRIPSVLNWVSLDFTRNSLRSSRTTPGATGSCRIAQSIRFYRRKKSSVPSEKDANFDGSEKGARLSRAARKEALAARREAQAARREAQAALGEYLHSTRSFQFVDADYMSRNSPHFLEKLLKKVNNDSEIGRSMARFLRYHPINEFEPFFESMGLKPNEYSPLLPRDLMFLNDDVMLLENYHVLCNYGMVRNNIGRIYKEATEVFKYDYGVLQSKLQLFEQMGLSQLTVIKFVTSSPGLLTGDRNREFFKLLEKFKSIGIECGWIEGHLLEENSYNFSHMHDLVCCLSNIVGNEVQLGKLICQHPGVLFESSGNMAFLLVGFLLKLGSTKNEICSVFLQFPQVPIRKFVYNLKRCFHFLVEIEMEVLEIVRIVRLHPLLLGSCSLKKSNTLLENLKTGKKRLCEIVKGNPQILKDWVLGSKITPLPNSGEELRSQMMKTKFLLDMGFVENSNEIKRALKVFRGKGEELQERFDCFVKAGLDRKDVSRMIKLSPQILNQSKDMIKMKIDFLLNGLGYPLSTLVSFPGYVNYTVQRAKLRFSMYNWLKDQGSVEPNLALSTILVCSDKLFISRYVNQHPGGLEVWKKLNKEIYPD